MKQIKLTPERIMEAITRHNAESNRERRRVSAVEDFAVMQDDQRHEAGAPLPPDPEEMNEKRALWAMAALIEFVMQTGSDGEDALSDFLADAMHWCDRHGLDFDAEVERARMHYKAETTPGPDPTPVSELKERPPPATWAGELGPDGYGR